MGSIYSWHAHKVHGLLQNMEERLHLNVASYARCDNYKIEECKSTPDLKNVHPHASRGPQTESKHTPGARLKVKDTFGIKDAERLEVRVYSRVNSDGAVVAKLLLCMLCCCYSSFVT